MYDFVRVAAAVPVHKVGDCYNNAAEIIRLMREASEKQVKVIVFPELSITGATCGDMFMQDSLIKASESALEMILKETADLELFAAVGMPVRCGNQLLNCAVCICKGEILGVIPKTYTSNDEERWFASASKAHIYYCSLCGQSAEVTDNIIFKNDGGLEFNVACEIGEDVYSVIPPSSYHALMGADIILNLSAQNEIVYKDDYTRSLLSSISARTKSVYAYANAGWGESTTDAVFSGHSFICENGVILKETEKFKRESHIIYCDCDIGRIKNERRQMNEFVTHYRKNMPDYDILGFELNAHTDKLEREINPHPFIPAEHERAMRCENIFNIQIAGLAKRLEHTNSNKAFVAVSGGLDSTLALLVTVKAFDWLKKDRKNIVGITMPGFGTTGRTYNNALELMRILGIDYREIQITDAILQHFKDIGHDPEIKDLTYENAQARERTQIVMDLTTKEGGIMIGPGNMSEIALGFSTYNGDHMSMYAVNCGIPKTLVITLVGYIAEIIPEIGGVLRDIINTPISPELLPPDENGNINQITEEVVGPYELHDFFLYYMLSFGFSPKKIAYLAQYAFKVKYTKEEIKKWLTVFYKRFFANQFKRSCVPDGPQVCSVGLSPRTGLKMPSDLCADVWLREVEEI